MIVLQETPFAANQPITCSKKFSFLFSTIWWACERRERTKASIYSFAHPPLLSAVNKSPAVLFSQACSTISKRKQRVCEKASQTKVNRLSYTIRDISGLICFLFLERRSLLLNSKLSTVKQTIYGRRAETLVDICVSAQCCESRWISLILSCIAVIC